MTLLGRDERIRDEGIVQGENKLAKLMSVLFKSGYHNENVNNKVSPPFCEA